MDLRIFPDAGDPAEIEYLAFMRPDFDTIPALPNLKGTRAPPASTPSFVIQTYRKCLSANWSHRAEIR
jgi:hypothetical protein